VAGERVLSEQNARTLVTCSNRWFRRHRQARRDSRLSRRRQDRHCVESESGKLRWDQYIGVFGGVAPATRLAGRSGRDRRSGGALYYGGDVAAPVFSAVVGGR
jgi:hypothetical protein